MSFAEISIIIPTRYEQSGFCDILCHELYKNNKIYTQYMYYTLLLTKKQSKISQLLIIE